MHYHTRIRAFSWLGVIGVLIPLSVIASGCFHMRLKQGCSSGYDGHACSILVQDLAKKGRAEQAYALARSAIDAYLPQCLDGIQNACTDVRIIAAALDAPDEVFYAVGPQSAALTVELCEAGIASACSNVAIGYLIGDVLPYDQTEATRYLNRACAMGLEWACGTAQRPQSAARSLQGIAANQYVAHELGRILEAHAAGRIDEGQARLVELAAVNLQHDRRDPELARLWNDAVALYWVPLVEEPFEAGHLTGAAVQAMDLALYASEFRERAAEVRTQAAEHHEDLARDALRPLGSRHLHARLAAYIHIPFGAGQRRVSPLVSETVPRDESVRYVTTTAHCQHALPPSDPEAAVTVSIDFERCVWSAAEEVRRQEIFETRHIPARTETVTHEKQGIISVTGCGHEARMSCHARWTVETTSVVEPGRTERVVAGHRDVAYLVQTVDVAGTARVVGSDLPPARFERKDTRTTRAAAAWAPDPAVALPAFVQDQVRHELGLALLTQRIEVARSIAPRVLEGDDPVALEDALARNGYSGTPEWAELLRRVSEHLGLSAPVLEAALASKHSR